MTTTHAISDNNPDSQSDLTLIPDVGSVDQQPTKMMTDDGAWENFYHFLGEWEGENWEVTPEKLLKREGYLSPDPDQPGSYIYTVVRHRRIAGATYTPGCPMSAYETYILRLLFDPVAKKLDFLSEEARGYKFDFYALALEQLDGESRPSVSRMASWKKKRRISISTHCFQLETSSLEEACEKIEKFYRGWNLSFCFEGLELTAEQKHQHEKSLSDTIVDQALGYLKNGWADPELIEE